jgi:hypothetical protein
MLSVPEVKVGKQSRRKQLRKEHGAAPQTAPISLLSITPIIDGKVNHGYVNSLLGIQRACERIGIPFNWSFVIGNSMLVAARNRCVAKFMEEATATHMLFLDADISVQWEGVMAALSSGKDIVALPCIKRSVDWERAVALVRSRPDVDAAAIQSVLGQPNFILDPEAPLPNEEEAMLGLMEATHAGTGCMVISRRALERYARAFPERWYYEYVNGKKTRTIEYFRYGRRDETFIGEDYTFCDDWRSIGGKVFVKVDGETSHSAEISLRYDLHALRALASEE